MQTLFDAGFLQIHFRDIIDMIISILVNANVSRLLSSLWVSRTGSASDWCALQEALYKCIDTIQYHF